MRKGLVRSVERIGKMIAAATVLNCGREAFWREGERTKENTRTAKDRVLSTRTSLGQ